MVSEYLCKLQFVATTAAVQPPVTRLVLRVLGKECYGYLSTQLHRQRSAGATVEPQASCELFCCGKSIATAALFLRLWLAHGRRQLVPVRWACFSGLNTRSVVWAPIPCVGSGDGGGDESSGPQHVSLTGRKVPLPHVTSTKSYELIFNTDCEGGSLR